MKSRKQRQTGFALVLVITVLGFAAIMGYAMLSSAALQAQVGGTARVAVSAETLAESGVNYALYYLQHPEIAPSLSNGFFPGQSAVSFADGKFDVTVSDRDRDGTTSLGTNTYLIKSVGTSAVLTRTLWVKAYVASKYRVVSAFSASNDVSIPSTISLSIIDDPSAGFLRKSTNPLVRSDAKMMLNAPSGVAGTVAATLTNASQAMAVPQYPSRGVPPLSGSGAIKTLQSYTTYTYNGNTYTADQLTWDPMNEVITANSATNPLNVWYTTTTRSLKGNVTLVGTLIMATGKTLKIVGNTTITAKPDPATGHASMPALVVDKDVSFEGLNRNLTVNGLMWVSNQIMGNAVTGLNWKLTVNGALMMPGAPAVAGAQLSSTLSGTVNLKYVESNVDLPDLSDKDKMPQSIKLLSWSSH